ncbi:hypothetical protein [Breoghania sp.]|uniref:hypothetical protein n=1 Tax=Breoghania sp. TaxID=2065378 RepID=UPI002605F114|nr:hypothetical protein [Breoghania sp.]MDJ0932126.1 hypothetical protein [Breoghania sp.]
MLQTHDRLMDMGGGARHVLIGHGHEGGDHVVLARGKACGALEQEGLVGQFDRIAVAEVHFQLGQACLVRHGGNLDAAQLAIVVDQVDDVVVVVCMFDAVGLVAEFLVSRQSHRHAQRHVRVVVLAGEVELEFRGDNRLQSPLGIKPEDLAQDLARGEIDRGSVHEDAVANDLGGSVPRTRAPAASC